MQPLLASYDAIKYLEGNALACADNIDILKVLPSASVDLIYIDPPFQSATNYVAIFGDKGQVDQQLKDIWRWTVETENTFQRLPHGPLLYTLKGIRMQAGEQSPMAAYSVFMGRRLMEMHRVLKPTGSIYMHCDYHANYYLRILLDAVFGAENFRNEIVWQRYGSHNDARRYGRVHDTILYYSKGARYTWTGEARIPYSQEYIKKAYRWSDEKGSYTTAPLHGRTLTGTTYRFTWRGRTDQWRFTQERLDALDAQGLIHWPKKRNGIPRRKVYLDKDKGVSPMDVFTDINPAQFGERLGYPTQKPLALLERIIQASSKKGDLVMDAFCGCGTAVDAAAKLGRKYLGIDVSAIAVRLMEQRLASRGDAAQPVVYGLDWSEYDWADFEKRALQSRADAEDGTPGWAWAEDKVAGLLSAVPNAKKTGDGGVDARFYGAAGEVIPIQVKMHRQAIGRPDMDRLLGAQTAMRNRGINAPMSLMVSLYEPPRHLRVFAAEQGRIELHGDDYPVLQAVSVKEMLVKGDSPKLPPGDPRSLVGDTQTRMVLTQ